MRKNASASVMSYFAERLLFELLCSLSLGGECLIELKDWRFCVVSKIEFLDEFSHLTWTMHWTLRSILSTSLNSKTVGQTCFFLWNVCGLWDESKVIFLSLIRISWHVFVWKNDFFGRMTDFFLQVLNAKCARLLRLACVQLHGKQLVCYSWMSSLDNTTLNM